MFAPLLFSLVLSGTVAAPAPSALSAPQPPVKVWLSSKGDFFFGERAKAYAQTAEDGYLVVLHADTRGRVRVLFPLDPSNDQFVKGGKKHELKGRGDREAFMAADSGRGVVLAAFSKSRFAVEKFTQNGHWDFRALAGDSVDRDPEAALMDVVAQMQGSDRYTYDVATYVVTDPRYMGYARYGPGWGGMPYGPRVGVSIRVGRPFYGRGYYYDPFYYDPFFFGYGPLWRGRGWW
ncbi:MAG: DUF4384 domain-containing protein [Gemmatimonadetes bacterium]|nr:DUF4384 domain-containing protein [Gemmatimonadota bacterium]